MSNILPTAREIALASFLITMENYQKGFLKSFEESVNALQRIDHPWTDDQKQALEFSHQFLGRVFP